MRDRQLRLLVVDDDAVDREQIRRCLAEHGVPFELDEAVTPSEVLPRADLCRYDCLLLDYRFPGGDALDLLAPVLALPCSERPPVVMMTGSGDESVAVEAMKRGAQDYLPKERITGATLWRAIDGAVLKARAERELQERTAELERMSFYDNLTGLPNRRLFLDRLDQTLRTAARRSSSFTVMLMDLDLFKQVNDELGHQAGDEVLCRIGERMQRLARDSDTFARLGGDEFAALLPTTHSPTGALVIAQKLCAAAAEPITLGEAQRVVGLSIGLALYPEHAETADDLLARADAAMYEAKRSRHGFVLGEPARAPARAART